MKRHKDYTIPYTGLKIGRHEFEFKLGNSFFEQFEYSEIGDCDIFIDVTLEKQATMLVLDFDIEGVIVTLCDRCQEPIEVEIEATEQLIVKFGDYTGSIEDEILVHGPGEHELNLAPYFYEYAHLAMPPKRVHDSMDQCNQDVIAYLSGTDDDGDDDDVDPRWEKLKDLK